MNSEILWAFTIVALSLTLSPGADWAYMIAAGIQKQVLPAILGIVSGYVIVVLIVATGLGVTLAKFPTLLTALTVIGAVYLAYLGVQMLQSAGKISAEKVETLSAKQWLTKGCIVSLLNVKGFLLLLAILPQFVRTESSWSTTNQILVLGFSFIACCLVIYPLVGIASKILLSTRPIAAQWVSRFSGVAMLTVAVGLAVEQFFL